MTRNMLQTFEDRVGSATLAAIPARRPSVATAEDATLRSVVESAVLPRLCLAFSRPASPAPSRQAVLYVNDGVSAEALAEAWTADDGVIAAVAERLLTDDASSVIAHLDAVRADGRSLAHIYLGVLMPAAVRLDDLRAADICGSAAATIAFCNLQSILRRYAPEFYAEAGTVEHTGFRALLAAPSTGLDGAGLQVFGLLLASELFRRDGWDTWTERSLSSTEFKEAVRSQWFDLVEVLANSDNDLDAIAAGIKLIRRKGPNPAVGIVACGPVFKDRPELVRSVGADLAASDALSSLSLAKHFVSRQTLRPRLS